MEGPKWAIRHERTPRLLTHLAYETAVVGSVAWEFDFSIRPFRAFIESHGEDVERYYWFNNALSTVVLCCHV
jgi:hypothetical protein